MAEFPFLVGKGARPHLGSTPDQVFPLPLPEISDRAVRGRHRKRGSKRQNRDYLFSLVVATVNVHYAGQNPSAAIFPKGKPASDVQCRCLLSLFESICFFLRSIDEDKLALLASPDLTPAPPDSFAGGEDNVFN